jgi:diadenosine tetraphosphatase ApaH/serine/threonine PP2A family protein phosphatase
MEGMLCDLVWSDPMEELQGQKEGWCDNPRDCAYQFGLAPIKKLQAANSGLLSVIRAH